MFGPSSTLPDLTRTIQREGGAPRVPNPLVEIYDRLLTEPRQSWTAHYPYLRKLGEGGQGVVYLSERRGADGFTIPVALKVFSPEPYHKPTDYDTAMKRIANVSARVSQIHQNNLLDVHDFIDRRRIRIMAMEWIEGYDLRQLLNPFMLLKIQDHVPKDNWDYLQNVVVTDGPAHPRLKPGVAVAVIRECLAGLAALHRQGIVHGDVKPSNVMLKRTGNAKIVDIGSAFYFDDPPALRPCTPAYAAPETLERQECSFQSDLASLGYVLIELLAGKPLFAGISTPGELIEAKLSLPGRLDRELPPEVSVNHLLMSFCRRLIAPDPNSRFKDADEAAFVKEGAAAFHRQLVLSNLSSEFENDVRLWIEALLEIDSQKAQGEAS
ncbi:MAG TPA: serine/threonine-protein kinase [Pirellulaceae bacterium]|jgi:serine/threonine-protein kinase|nr:serine/threonine-protein kinase [Pirellulaceae bacterium]